MKPVRSALNVMWIISHPDKISHAEYAEMDVVFAASPLLQKYLWTTQGIRAHLLLQATDPSRFSAEDVKPIEAVRDKVLFVGNSRMQLRPIVVDAIRAKLPLTIYGKDWSPFIPPKMIQGEYIENCELGNWYGSSKVVLNDHWQNMREFGIISNRIFDVVATGRPVITDSIDGLEPIFGDAVRSYSDYSELPGLVEMLANTQHSEVAKSIRTAHSFKARVGEVLKILGIPQR